MKGREEGDSVVQYAHEAMNHRFAIFPAGAADSVEQANDLVCAMATGIEGQPHKAVRELFDELDDILGRYLAVRPADARGAVIATDRPEDGLLRYLLQSAAARGLAVYDIELFRLYDPRGRVDVEVELCGLALLPYVTPTLLRDLVLRPTWPAPENPFLILARGEHDHIQAYRDPNGTYQFEYRDGGPDAHFQFFTADCGLVADVMWAWVNDDPSWRTAVRWSPLVLDDDDSYRSSPSINSTIHVDRNSDRELGFSDTDGQPFLAYHAGNPGNEVDGDDRPVPTGWVLHVDRDESFVTGVLGFNRVDDALTAAETYLGVSPASQDRRPRRCVSLLDERREDGSWLNLDATLQPDGSLRIDGQDLGPVTEPVSPDGEYEYGYTIAAQDVPAMVIALGGQHGTDIIDLLEHHWSGAQSYGLGAAIRSSGVPHHFWNYP
ncbi:hypothetical protein JDV09_00695 [Mycobacterium sp. Y57]|nr:hypothetical protein [Mycolicibacterium xanthum]